MESPGLKQVLNIKYSEKEILGEGAYAKVYKGMTTDTDEIVAVKVIGLEKVSNSPLLKKFLQRETAILKFLRENKSPYLVELKHIYQTPNNLYIVMEHCDGGNLDEYIKGKSTKNSLPEAEVREIFAQLAKGMEILIKNHIVHRDIKRQNIIRNQGIWKIADFGVSRRLEEENNAFTRVGTPYYMPPQILFNEGHTNKCDMWSLGVLLYSCLVGSFPFDVNTKMSFQDTVKNAPVVFPPYITLSPEMKKLILKMLEKEEADRLSWDEFFKFDWGAGSSGPSFEDSNTKRSPGCCF